MLLAAARGGHLPAVGSPQRAAFINAPDSEAGWRHVVEIGEDWRWAQPCFRSLATRSALPPGSLRIEAALPLAGLRRRGRPGRKARPGDRSRTPGSAGELRTYPEVDHFSTYDGPQHDAIVADQLDFLRRHLPGDRLSRPNEGGAQ